MTLASTLSLAACRDAEPSAIPQPPEPRVAAPFVHRASSDLSGYYLPLAPVRFGAWTLDHVFIGQSAELKTWPAKGASPVTAPVVLVFRSADGPAQTLEPVLTKRSTISVLPSVYVIDDERFRFEGRSSELGRVTFDGQVDPGSLATARRNLGHEGAALTGMLTVGGYPPEAARLRWWMGG
jgi:hypothetical protein